MTDFQITGQAEFKAFVRRLKSASNGRELRLRVARAMRAAARPVVRDVQAAVMAIEVKGVAGRGAVRREGTFRARKPNARTVGFGLRASVARGVKASVRMSGRSVGLRIFVDVSHLPRSQRNLPAHLDNPKGWRHPVYGNRDVWVRQFGEPYFRRTVIRHTPRVRAAIQDAVTSTLKELLQ